MEENTKRYYLRNLLVKIILLIILILLIIWLVPTPKVNYNGANGQIFNSNINTMKDAGLRYFTTDKLPADGKTVRLTLGEMLEKHLVLPILDKDGKACDSSKSYFEVTKTDDNKYNVKVNLSCGKVSDYIVVPVGCYNYCPAKSACEKQVEYKNVVVKRPVIIPETISKIVTSEPGCELFVTSGRVGENGWYLSDATVGFKYKGTSNDKVSLTAYGLSFANAPIYNRVNSLTVEKNGINTVYGYVKDSTGKTAICSLKVKKDTTKPSCNMNIVSGTLGKNGVYVGDVKVAMDTQSNGVSKVVAYGLNDRSDKVFNMFNQRLVIAAGDHNVYGFVKNEAGNTGTCNIKFTNRKETSNERVSHPSCDLDVVYGRQGENGWYNTNVKVQFTSKKSTNGATITAYGITNGPKEYNSKDTAVAVQDGYYIIKGFVKDSNGNESVCAIKFKKDATKPVCSLAATNGLFKDGYYQGDVTVGFNDKNDNVSGVQSFGIGFDKTLSNNNSLTVTKDGNTTVYGYVKDNAGNENVCSIAINKKKVGYEYQYKKNITANYGDWSDWTYETYDPSHPPRFGKTDTEEKVDLGYTEINRYTMENATPLFQQVMHDYKTVNERYCDGFDYYRSKTYTATRTERVVTETTTTVTTVETITTKNYVTKSGSAGKEKYVGIVSVSNIPTNTLSSRYEYVGLDWDRCGANCTTTPYTKWKKYTKGVGVSYNTVETTKVYAKDSHGNRTSRVLSSDSNTKVTVTYDGVSAECRLVERPVHLYIYTKELVGYDVRRVAHKEKQYTYKVRTRKVVGSSYTDYKWSSYNNKELLDNGYVMTGNKRIIY